MQLFKKIINVVINILVVILLVISALTAFMSISSASTGVPNLFGYALFSVQSQSMVPTFSPGDLIIGKTIDENTELNVGDVITFVEEVDGVNIYNSHRIINIKTTHGVKLYYTKGDNNPDADANPVVEADIKAKYNGTCLSGLGAPYDFLRSQLGFFLVILLPLILFFLYEVFRVVKNLIDYNKAKAIEQAAKAFSSVSANSSGLTEEQLQEALKNYMDKQNQGKDASSDLEENQNNTEE